MITVYGLHNFNWYVTLRLISADHNKDKDN